MIPNWVGVYNALFSQIDRPGDCYYSGPRFISRVRETDPYFLTYKQYLEHRQTAGKSTSRRDFFYDILLEMEDTQRVRVMLSILGDLEKCEPNAAAEMRQVLGGQVNAPVAVVPDVAWNADRLNENLADIDDAIRTAQYERAVNLAYTCLEGFYKAFVKQKEPATTPSNEIITLSRWVRDYLRNSLKDYPDEVLNLINHTSYAIDKARNRFSEAHFGDEAGLWLATYSRDLVNTQIRLLLHFF